MSQNIPEAVLHFLAEEGFGEITSVEPLTGGVANLTRRISTTAHISFVLKQNAEKWENLFSCEAAGLAALCEAGMRTPHVWAVDNDFLLLEDLGNRCPSESSWEAFGRALARQHQHTNDRFGFAYDNYLGVMPQRNPWTDDGYEFFAQYRVLRYLPEPLCEQTLSAQDRRNIEKLVKRLPELIPPQQPSLLHGDLWHANMLVDAHRVPAVIDPAVYYGWPEAELSMTRQYGKVPRIFFDAYIEVNPLAEGWWDRLEVLYIREYLALIAHLGNTYHTLERLHELMDKFC